MEPILAGIDEKGFRRGHEYVTVVADIIEGSVLYVADDPDQESLEPFWTETLSEQARAEVEAITMDT